MERMMKLIDSELYELAIPLADKQARLRVEFFSGHFTKKYKLLGDDLKMFNMSLRYLELREASGEPMPYKVIRDGDKVRFE